MKTWTILIYLAATLAVSFLEEAAGTEKTEEYDLHSDTTTESWSLRRWLNHVWSKLTSSKETSDKKNDDEECVTALTKRGEKEWSHEKEQMARISSSEIHGGEKVENEEMAHVNDTSNEIHKEEEEGEGATAASKKAFDFWDPLQVHLNAREMPPTASNTAYPTTIPTTPATTTCPPHKCPPTRSNPWVACTDPTPEDDATLTEALTEFAVEFYKAAIQNKKHTSNLVFSPLSISMMLSNLLLGTCDETTSRFEKLLFYPKDFTCIHKALKALSKSEALISANAIFYQPELKLDSEFRNLTGEFYQTKLSPLTNNSNQDLLDINSWVSKHTGNKIKKLLDDLEPDAQMVLLNAIYFQAKWKTVFSKKDTKMEKFYRPGLPAVRVRMLMSKKYPVASYFDHNLQAKIGRFQLSSNMSLVIIVPRSLSQNLSEVEQRLSANIFKSVMTKLESIHFKSTIVSLPKFKVDSSQDLTEIIGRMDYGLFFDANLCGISQDEELAVSGAQHKAVVEINEEGVEAAAASGVSLARSANFFEVQQPFLFALTRDHKAPIFLGRITDPLSP